MSEDFPQEERPPIQEGVDQFAPTEQSPIADTDESELTHIPVHSDDDQAEEVQVTSTDPSHDQEIEERLNDLRDRGRVGVLTEATERNDTTDRLNNSDHDPDAIAQINKANRASQAELNKHHSPTRGAIGRAYERQNEVFKDRLKREGGDDLAQFHEDEEGWEKAQREWLNREDRPRFMTEFSPDDEIERSRWRNRGKIEWEEQGRDEAIKQAKESIITSVERRGRAQDEYRGDMLEMYARNPNKYKEMSVEEFVESGRSFKQDERNLSVAEQLNSIAVHFDRLLPDMEGGASIEQTLETINIGAEAIALGNIRFDIETESLIAAIKNIVIDPDAPVEVRSKADEDIRFLKYGLREGRKLLSATDLLSDWDTSPRKNLEAMNERIKALTDVWHTRAEETRKEFEEKWGAKPEQPEPVAA